MDRVNNLKQALPYIQQHRGKTFVIKLGGRVFEKPEALKSLAQDIALLHNVGINLVVVHGGGPQLSAMANKLGIPQNIVEGRRVTGDDTLDLAKMLFRGKLNIDLVAALREAGAVAVGLSGGDGGLVSASRRPVVTMQNEQGQDHEVDFGHVGDVTDVNPQVLRVLNQAQYIPVVCSLASTPTGGILNVNADTVAQRIATSLKAEKLFLLTDQQGLFGDFGDPSSLVSYCDAGDLEGLIGSGKIKGGMKPKLQATLKALAGGVHKVHIVSAFQPSSLLLEVFTNEGCGTLVVKNKNEVHP